MITDFLKSKRDIKELMIALDVINEFKKCETSNWWLKAPSKYWVKIEQLQEFLNHMVNGKPLTEETIEYMKEFRSK